MKPPALRPDRTLWQLTGRVDKPVGGAILQCGINNAATVSCPLGTAAFDAPIGEPKPLLGTTALGCNFNEVAIDRHLRCHKRDPATGSDDTEQNRSRLGWRARTQPLNRASVRLLLRHGTDQAVAVPEA